MSEQKTETKDNFRHFIRIMNTDLEGSYAIERALRKIKGISFQFSNAICSALKIDRTQKAGYVDDLTIKRIDELLKDPSKFNIPHWMFNRRKDYETGKDKHLLVADLDFVKDNDIKLMKKIKSYKGVRHIKGLPVRGQRTKSHFRVNKGKAGLGVKKNPQAKAGK